MHDGYVDNSVFASILIVSLHVQSISGVRHVATTWASMGMHRMCVVVVISRCKRPMDASTATGILHIFVVFDIVRVSAVDFTGAAHLDVGCNQGDVSRLCLWNISQGM